MTGTNEPPAFGPARNAALAKRLGYTAQKRCGINKDYWVLLDPQGKVCATSSAGEDAVFRTKGKPLPSGVPDYCGSDADCFGLLAELVRVNEFYIQFYDEGHGKTCEIQDCPPHDGPVNHTSNLPNKREALRDAITAAAWQALTAKKEAENE